MWSRRNVRGVSVVVPAVLHIILGQGCGPPGISVVSWLCWAWRCSLETLQHVCGVTQSLSGSVDPPWYFLF